MLTPLDRTHVGKAGATLAIAMSNDPIYRHIVPDDERRHRWLVAFMTDLLAMLHPLGHVYGVGTGDVEGVIALSPPGRHRLPIRRAAGFALANVLRRPSRRPTWRSLVAGARIMMAVEGAHPTNPHWYLWILGVAPSAQGKGIGRRLIESAIGLAEADGHPLYLETTNKRNIELYEHFGFCVQQRVAYDGSAPPTWTMIRHPSQG